VKRDAWQQWKAATIQFKVQRSRFKVYVTPFQGWMKGLRFYRGVAPAWYVSPFQG